MTEASAIIIPDASTLTVDTSCIDVSEVESQEDKDFLIEKGEKILRVVARAALEVGQELIEIQEQFRENDIRGTGLVKYYKSIGLTQTQVCRWTAKYKAFKAYMEIFGEIDCDAPKKFNDLADRAASKLISLPTEYREAFFADIALGDIPSQNTLEEVSKRPEVKLSKVEELLAAAKIRQAQTEDEWEMARINPEIRCDSPEYKKADKARRYSSKIISRYEQQIQELQQQIEQERLEKLEETKKKERILADLEKLKSDDAAKRAERIAHLTNTLTVSIPEVLADLQKFFAEADEYPEDVRAHLIEQSTYLTNYIADQLD